MPHLVDCAKNYFENPSTNSHLSIPAYLFPTESWLFQLSVLLQFLVVCGTRNDLWGNHMLRTFSKHHWTLVQTTTPRISQIRRMEAFASHGSHQLRTTPHFACLYDMFGDWDCGGMLGWLSLVPLFNSPNDD